jgi:hypothetical protein
VQVVVGVLALVGALVVGLLILRLVLGTLAVVTAAKQIEDTSYTASLAILGGHEDAQIAPAVAKWMAAMKRSEALSTAEQRSLADLLQKRGIADSAQSVIQAFLVEEAARHRESAGVLAEAVA